MKRKVALVIVGLCFIGYAIDTILEFLFPDPSGGQLDVLISLTWALITGTTALWLLQSIQRGPVRFSGWASVAATGLRMFATLWGIGFAVLNAAMMLNAFHRAPDFWEGIVTVQAVYAPSVGTAIIVGLLLSPAVGAWSLADRVDGATQ